MTYYKKKPKHLGVLLGKVNYGGSIWSIYNKNGQALFLVKSKASNMWILSDKHVGSGYILRQLGIEASAGGTIFRHYTLPENAFYGKNRKQIIKLQRNAGQ